MIAEVYVYMELVTSCSSLYIYIHTVTLLHAFICSIIIYGHFGYVLIAGGDRVYTVYKYIVIKVSIMA